MKKECGKGGCGKGGKGSMDGARMLKMMSTEKPLKGAVAKKYVKSKMK